MLLMSKTVGLLDGVRHCDIRWCQGNSTLGNANNALALFIIIIYYVRVYLPIDK